MGDPLQSPAPSAGPSQLAEALTAAEAALRRGDHAAAAEAILRGGAACQALAASGPRALPSGALEALRAAQARCLGLAEAELARLGGKVTLAAKSRRATDAYTR